jgi:hypothetical protein
MSLALTIQILLAQIAMPALQEKGEEPQLIFFAQDGHWDEELRVGSEC